MKRFFPLFLFVTYLTLTASGCGTDSPSSATPAAAAQAASQEQKDGLTSFELTSAAFASGQPIPSQYTCQGKDVSPSLQWKDPPPDAQSFALISDDPDAPGGSWVHWVLYNLPAESHSLSEALPPQADLLDGGQHGRNSWGRLGYGGPCPPSGTHRYFFKLYALDTTLDLDAGADKGQVLRAMEGHILAEAELMGVYAKK
jgi:Raf kinase inhibitor-like YbhB/YbcL family protein